MDLEPADPARFFRDKKIRGNVDSLSFLGEDYRDWLSQSQPLPVSNRLRIALVSKLFNNLSNFDICDFDADKSSPLFKNMTLSPTPNSYLPSRCLSPTGKGAGALVISNARIALHNGRTFAQASLSDYYRGMYIISRLESSADIPEGLFLPVRSFNPECLVTSRGKSVLSCLAENCDCVVIEDADLRPQDLIEHMKTFLLHSISVRDMTKSLGLMGNYAYIIRSKSKLKGEPDFGGECIW